jgi:hypothetical protein
MTSKTTEPKITHESPEYLTFKAEHERNHYFLKQPPKYAQITNGNTYLYSYQEFVREVHGDDPLVKLWVKDPRRLTYLKKVFVPYTKKNTAPKDCINTFSGFKYFTPQYEMLARQKKPEFSTEWFHEYLDGLAEGDAKVKQFLYDYCADIIQNPERSPELCLIMKGKEGGGKDTFMNINAGLLGEQFKYSTANFDEVFGTCNSELDGRILLGIEEVSMFDTKKYKERMKNLITCDKITIKQIYVPKQQVDNMLRVFMTSNHNTPIHVDAGQRRYLIFNIPSTRVGDKPYWNWLYQQKVGNDKVMATLFWELYNYNLDPKWNDNHNLPKSKEQADMETENVYPLWSMLDEYFNSENPLYDEKLIDTFVCNDFEDVPENSCYITSENFTNMFLDYCQREQDGFKNFSRKAHIDNHLRACDAIECKTRRIYGDKTPLKLINVPELLEYIDRENLVGKRSHNNFQRETKEE